MSEDFCITEDVTLTNNSSTDIFAKTRVVGQSRWLTTIYEVEDIEHER
ncbi:MAG: hypothetical protein OYL97_05610 [Candidatus Poribacteria bacterium]|nr:hypothetical protein [Candidatus Poribacteria bacterium]